ncbi:MAG TPA: glycerophosphodiester phosphodiesterase family protein [Verrucomicrobiota bacterium]|nr:glycerophosphodiester phosphodiesterase family protein [Verrucomicrobiota bacterium]
MRDNEQHPAISTPMTTQRRPGPLTPIAALALALAATAFAADRPAAETLLAEKRPLVIGHRGYPALAPENTLPSFEFALAAGADLVELDYYHASDGIPVVIHDADLDRTTDAKTRWQAQKIRTESRSSTDLQTLDAGSWYNRRYAGTRIPLLNEALDLIQKKGVTLIERKAGDPRALVELLHQRQWINQLVVQSFDWEYLREFHRLEPRQILGALGPPGSVGGRKLTDEEKALSQAWVDQVRALGATIVVWNRQVTQPAVDYAHSLGLKVWAYTINEAPLANTLWDAGVDGIITDNPAVIWRARALRQ